MNIRLYTDEDKEACLAIFDSNHPLYFTSDEREQFTDWLDNPDREAYYVLEDNTLSDKEKIVACGGIFYDSGSDYVGLAWGMIHANFHRKGYGSHFTRYRLMQLQDCYPGKTQRIETSQHTVAFYEKMGFQVVQMYPDGFGVGLDKYEMTKSGL